MPKENNDSFKWFRSMTDKRSLERDQFDATYGQGLCSMEGRRGDLITYAREAPFRGGPSGGPRSDR